MIKEYYQEEKLKKESSECKFQPKINDSKKYKNM